MTTCRRAPLTVLAVAAAFLIYASAGLAGTSPLVGTVPNGGCDLARHVSVSGPSRIEVTVASTSADGSVVAQIVAPNGKVVATGSYDTPSAGDYSVQICSLGSSLDSPQIQYSSLIGMGSAGQRVLSGVRLPATTR
jgi:hypothetical protein